MRNLILHPSAFILIALACQAGTITMITDLEADTSKAVTGPQSNQVAAAAAHVPRTDNPHGVTAGQLGALTSESDPLALPLLADHTNAAAIHLAPAQAVRLAASLTNETDASALAALAALAAYAASGKVSEVWSGPATWWTFTPSNVIYRHTFSTETNGLRLTFSEDFAEGSYLTQPPQTEYIVDYAWSWGDGNWLFAMPTDRFFISHSIEGDTSQWESTNDSPPATLYPSDGYFGVGVAYVDWNIVGTQTVAYVLGTGGVAAASGGIATNDVIAIGDERYAQASVTNAPVWIGTTNLGAAVGIVLTNLSERPHYLYGTGSLAVAFHGLRSPQPVYLVVRGPAELMFPGAYIVGGGSYQTNHANHYIAWSYSTNVFVSPITTTED